ncbi:MAG: ammonium transporter [Planctomycetota bacterium]
MADDAGVLIDQLWIILAAALVMLMTPAVGLFYGGLVRQKNVLSTVMYSFFTLAIVSIVWAAVGFSLSFGSSVGGIIGSFEHAGLRGLDPSGGPGSTDSYIFMLFQMTFAVITPALISGAFAERKRFGAFVMFTVLWCLLVYTPVAHWVWGGGWLSSMVLFGESGLLDFAGGKVVHITSGVSALVCAFVLGRRHGDRQQIQPHNATLTVLGASLLWFGWFGFNGGSALGVNGQAINAITNTHLAASTAAIVWLTLAWIHHGKPSVIGAAVGAVAGLVGITPAAGYVMPVSSIAIGLVTAIACFYATEYVVKGRVDDALDVFGVHGVGGIFGAILTAVLASSAAPGNGVGGLIEGNTGLFFRQLLGVLIVAAFSGTATFLILKCMSLVLDLRVSEADETTGLDRSQHGESILPSGLTGEDQRPQLQQ